MAGNPGRPRGEISLNMRRAMEVKRAVYDSFDRLGSVDYLVKLGQEDPRTFIALLAKILPNEIKAELTGNEVAMPSVIKIVSATEEPKKLQDDIQEAEYSEVQDVKRID